MIEVSMIRDLVTIFGVIAGFSYYVLTVQTQMKNQKLSTTHRLLQDYNDIQNFNRWHDMMSWKWDTIEEFWDKYEDQENNGKYILISQYFDGLGFLWDSGVLDKKAFPLFADGYLILWRKFKPIILDMRENYPNWCIYWEKLANTLEKEIGHKIPPRYSEGWN